MTTCKKKDVLSLSFEDYQKNRDLILKGYELSRKFLLSQYVFRIRFILFSCNLNKFMI